MAGNAVHAPHALDIETAVRRLAAAEKGEAQTADITPVARMTFCLARDGDAANDPGLEYPVVQEVPDRDSLASYIRVELRVMAGDNTLCVSRYLIQ
jgi:hypothetical protein